jgi:hypothetical protein
MRIQNKRLIDKETLIQNIRNLIIENQLISGNNRWVIITAGAGDIDAMIPALKEKILNG